MATDKSVMVVIRASRPSFRNNYDKVAFTVHASFLASGFVLTATGPPAFSDTALSSSSTDEVGIDHWNEVDGEYAFVYANPEKGSKKVLVKCLVMNDKLLVDALADGSSEPVHLEINVGDYVGENGDSNYSTQFKNLDRLVKSLDSEIFSKLDGSSKASSSSNLRSSETSDGSRPYVNEPVSRVPESPGVFIHPSGVLYPPAYPVGGSDLFPGPGAGMYPHRGDFGSGNMLVGPNDPRFFGGGGEPGFPGAQPGVPPGARFDPYGPPGVPGFEPNRFTRTPPRRPGSGTHPDLEHFGSGSDFI
ncbi:PI31 proteasome regulator [Parasponia andersonii]|uniref:PI31 proteasome regulator n=1 Tax=Parasponia andersonii TaxID=3476 RepID=A0A2P5CFV9_PARAD|nr:PI31 proteasome regulator [Parasponia andersonii]